MAKARICNEPTFSSVQADHIACLVQVGKHLVKFSKICTRCRTLKLAQNRVLEYVTCMDSIKAVLRGENALKKNAKEFRTVTCWLQTPRDTRILHQDL